MDEQFPLHPAVKALMRRENVDQRTEEWYRKRKGLLTASDVATALGQNPYKSRATLLKEKCCPEERKSSSCAATEHGNKYEDEAIELYEKMYNQKVYRFGLFVSEEYPSLGGSPNGVTHDGLLVEVKCPLSRAIKNEVPVYYMAQLQVLMVILNLVSLPDQVSDITGQPPYCQRPNAQHAPGSNLLNRVCSMHLVHARIDDGRPQGEPEAGGQVIPCVLGAPGQKGDCKPTEPVVGAGAGSVHPVPARERLGGEGVCRDTSSQGPGMVRHTPAHDALLRGDLAFLGKAAQRSGSAGSQTRSDCPERPGAGRPRTRQAAVLLPSCAGGQSRRSPGRAACC